MKQFLVKGRKWFDKTYGNTYHTVEILFYTSKGQRDSENDICSDITYGYDDQYITTAFELLKKAKCIPEKLTFSDFYKNKNNEFSSWYVNRKKDM